MLKKLQKKLKQEDFYAFEKFYESLGRKSQYELLGCLESIVSAFPSRKLIEKRKTIERQLVFSVQKLCAEKFSLETETAVLKQNLIKLYEDRLAELRQSVNIKKEN